jgi:short-subunit dehydrogenase
MGAMTITDLNGKRVLLTGATGGIGRAIAHALAEQGAELILTGRRVDVLDELARELKAATVAADLARIADINHLMTEADEVDVLVVNHALPASGLVLDLTEEAIQRIVAINLLAPILLAQKAAAAMKERGSGQIVLVGSLSSKAATSGSALYNATKFGLRGFSLAFRQDLHDTGVGVSLVMPGFVSDAGMFAETGLDAPPGAGTVTPLQVAHGVLKAILKDRAEVTVAPLSLRAGTTIGHLMPEVSALVQRKFTPPGYMEQFIAGQEHKR